MKTPIRHPNLLRLLIVILAILPMIALYLLPVSWTRQVGAWTWLLLALGNGLLWMCLAAALVTINRDAPVDADAVPARLNDKIRRKSDPRDMPR
jgi:hypothetical protein